jgi:hypothetical protein
MLSRRVYDIFSPAGFCIRCCKEGVFCAVQGRAAGLSKRSQYAE